MNLEDAKNIVLIFNIVILIFILVSILYSFVMSISKSISIILSAYLSIFFTSMFFLFMAGKNIENLIKIDRNVFKISIFFSLMLALIIVSNKYGIKIKTRLKSWWIYFMKAVFGFLSSTLIISTIFRFLLGVKLFSSEEYTIKTIYLDIKNIEGFNIFSYMIDWVNLWFSLPIFIFVFCVFFVFTDTDN